MRAAFFDYDPSISGYRYIVLTDEDPILETSSGGPTDEGYSYTETRWALDTDEGTVRCETTTDARDCDGWISHQSDVECHIDDLASLDVYPDGGDAEASEHGPAPFRVPAWREVFYSQRDYSAEAAGY